MKYLRSYLTTSTEPKERARRPLGVLKQLFIVTTLCLCVFALDSAAAPFDLIICGSGGQKEYQQRFSAWGERLRTVLSEKIRHPADHIVLLTEADVMTPVSLQRIAATIRQLHQRLTPEDDLFIYLIGHGNYRDNAAKLHIPGPDLAATELDTMLAHINARHLTLINTASSSAPFINILGTAGRSICTSTKSAEERDATWFMEYFIQALETGSADQNRDGRFTVLEVCNQASVLTQEHYATQRLIATEHALLDDNGDGLGTRLPITTANQSDGALSNTAYIKDVHYPPNTTQQQITSYRSAVEQVEKHIKQKQEIPRDQYYQRLEELLLNAARINRTIHSEQK